MPALTSVSAPKVASATSTTSATSPALQRGNRPVAPSRDTGCAPRRWTHTSGSVIEPAAGSEALVIRHSSSGSSRVTLPATDPCHRPMDTGHTSPSTSSTRWSRNTQPPRPPRTTPRPGATDPPAPSTRSGRPDPPPGARPHDDRVAPTAGALASRKAHRGRRARGCSVLETDVGADLIGKLGYTADELGFDPTELKARYLAER